MEKYFTEKEILHHLDLAFRSVPDQRFLHGDCEIMDNKYLDLQAHDCATAGSRIHLYADDERWAIVFEKVGYNNVRQFGGSELYFVGSSHVVWEKYSFDRKIHFSNTYDVETITPEAFEEVNYEEGVGDLGNWELIAPDAKTILLRDKHIPIEHDHTKYAALGIHVRDYDNPLNLIGFEDLMRYLYETDPDLISATEDDIKQTIPADLPKLMMIDKFRYEILRDQRYPPSMQETYKMIAKILVTDDTSHWKPTEELDNHWSNWDSGYEA